MGRPVATSAWPLDQAMMSAGMASICEVGLEIGKITGRSRPGAHGLDDLLR